MRIYGKMTINVPANDLSHMTRSSLEAAEEVESTKFVI